MKIFVDDNTKAEDLYGKLFEAIDGDCVITIKPVKHMRTVKQQAAIEVLCRNAAEDLNNAGITRSTVINALKVDQLWSQESIKEIVWRYLQEFYGFGRSTSTLKTDQVTKVADSFTLFMARFGITAVFPSKEEVEHKS